MPFDPKAFTPTAGKPLTPTVQLTTARFGRCGHLLLAGSMEGDVRRWHWPDAVEWPALPMSGWVTGLAAHPDGQRLFAADSFGRISCWAHAERAPRLLWDAPTAHAQWVRQLALAPDGATLASISRDGTARRWDARTGQPHGLALAHPVDGLAVAYHPQGDLLTGDLKGTVRQWDAAGQCMRTFAVPELFLRDRLQDVGGVRWLTTSPDGATLAVAGCKPKGGGFVEGTPIVQLLDWTTGKPTTTLTLGGPTDGYAHMVHWHPAGFLLIATSGQPGRGQLLFHEPTADKPFFSAKNVVNCHAVDVHPNGKTCLLLATNANSSGNGRTLKGGEYPGNVSPILTWTWTG